jgi:hypothetical protein
LSIVLGELSIETSFYSSDHPDAVPGFSLSVAPWVTPGRMAREGFAVICRDEGCAAHALQLAAGHPGVRRDRIEVTRTFLGVPSAPKHFVLVLAPPRQAGQ